MGNWRLQTDELTDMSLSAGFGSLHCRLLNWSRGVLECIRQGGLTSVSFTTFQLYQACSWLFQNVSKRSSFMEMKPNMIFFRCLTLMIEVTIGIHCNRQTSPFLPAYVAAQTSCHSSSRPKHCLFTHTEGINSLELISDSTGKMLVPPW